jgi:large subunit ribosomal protein L21
MYAIVEIAGQQFKVVKNQEIFVHRLEGEEGSGVNFDQVLLLDQDGSVTVGSPALNGASVKAKIIEHLKGDKVLVFHKKRRKGYQKQTGHRQFLSKILIEDIVTGEVKTETVKKARTKKEVQPSSETPRKTKVSKAAEEFLSDTDKTDKEIKIDVKVADNNGTVGETKAE